MFKISRTIFFSLAGLLFFSIIFDYQFMPATVASHFNARGIPDAYSNKKDFIFFLLIISTIITALFPLMNFVVGKTPIKYLNLPNRTYWLADERKQYTIDILKQYTYIIGSITIAFFIFIFNYIYYKTFNADYAQDGSFLMALIIFIGALAFTLVKMILRFFKKESK